MDILEPGIVLRSATESTFSGTKARGKSQWSWKASILKKKGHSLVIRKVCLHLKDQVILGNNIGDLQRLITRCEVMPSEKPINYTPGNQHITVEQLNHTSIVGSGVLL